jgi:hypothetical protein
MISREGPFPSTGFLMRFDGFVIASRRRDVMKKKVLIGLALMTVFFTAKASAAADYELGLKLWANTWKETVEQEAGDSQRFDNGSALMAGPSLLVKFPGRWFVSATYLETVGEYKSFDWIVPGDTMSFKRQSRELRAGRMFQPRFLFRPDPGTKLGVFVGYRYSIAPATYTNPAAGYTDSRFGTWKQKGTSGGFLAEHPLTPSMNLFAEISFASLQQEFKFTNDAAQPFHAFGVGYELGVSYDIRGPLSAHAGFKYEQSSGTEETGQIDRNSFYGLIAGITYAL